MNKQKTITREQRNIAIRRLSSRGLTYREIASKLNVSNGTVHNAINERRSKADSSSKEDRNKLILDMRAKGDSYTAIARKVSMDVSSVWRIINGRKLRTTTKKKPVASVPTRMKRQTKKTAPTPSWTFSFLWGAIIITHA